MVLGNTGSVLTDLIDQNSEDLQELNERTNSCAAVLEKRLLKTYGTNHLGSQLKNLGEEH